MRKPLCVIGVLLVVITVVGLVMEILSSRWETGPGCPGDPEWLGFCSEVPVK